VLLGPTVTVAGRIATVSLLLVLRVCADSTLRPLNLQPKHSARDGPIPRIGEYATGNAADVTQAHALLHGDEKAVLGDDGYKGLGKRAENVDKAIDWHTAICPSVRTTPTKNPLGRAHEKLEKARASVRAQV
jgi:hypothetical protein